MMRPGFLEIVHGWTLVDDSDELSDRIERAAAWTQANAPVAPEERAAIRLMITHQVAWGIRRGDFEPYIPADTDVHDVLNLDVEVKP